MRRFRIHTTWGATFGVKVDKTLEQLIVETRRNGYICTPFVYVMFSAIAGVEDEDMVEAMQEAAAQEEWQ